MVRHRVRIRFRKEGDLRLIGHHDLARAWERAFRRAGLALRMSEGFRPKPRMVFASALALGVIGADEALDVELADARCAEEIHSALSDRLPVGLSINRVELLAESAPKPRVERVRYELPVPAERRAKVAERLAAGAAGSQVDGREATAFIEEIDLADGLLRFTARVTPEGATRPRDLLAWLELSDLDEQGLYLTRTAVELAT
ncbi:MAG TPA: TIGR03936 family radical SAM-associated protein [Pirellulales bacterium]|nr:TIGR03936 family radical SAM-associated protein [Pirellulales bacterium]